MQKTKLFLTRCWFVWVLAVFLPVFILIAVKNEHIVDYLNNGFFTFWLSGHLQLAGGHPYISAEWVNGHHANGATWIPNQIFPYPLPLALLTIPLGFFPIGTAYILWDVLAQVLIASCILWLSTGVPGKNRQFFGIIILIVTVLNGNIYLGLMTGTFAALFLVFLTLSLFFIESDRPFLAGIMLAGLALKPPFLAITALIGFWLLFQRNWKALAGIVTGGLGLLIIGLIQDPHWVEKFLGAGENLFSLRLGNQPTFISYTRLLCSADTNCTNISYGLIVATLTGLFVWHVWKNHARLSARMVFSAGIALGVLLPPYIWSYDYTLLLIPVCFISFELINRRTSFVYSTLFLIALDVLSITGLALFWMNPESSALTIQRDMWSIWVAFYVLAFTWWLVFRAHPVRIISEK